MGKRYFVTGGAGFIGSHTVDALVAAGNLVTVYDIKSWETAVNLHHQHDAITYVSADICDQVSLRAAMVGHTHVLHLAAIVSVPLSIEDPLGSHATNVTGTLEVFAAAEALGIQRVVYASSAAVYGDTGMTAVAEDAAHNPLSPYGLHKCINEQYATLFSSMYDLSTIGLRYFNVFGARQDPASPYSGVISIFADRLARNESLTVYGNGSATRDFVYINNIVAANIRALEGDITGVYNVGTGVSTSILTLIDSLASAMKVSANTVFEEARKGDIAHSLADITAITKQLGYRVETDFQSGISDLVIKT